MTVRGTHEPDCDALFGDTCSCREIRKARKLKSPRTGLRARVGDHNDGQTSLGDGNYYRRPLHSGGY